MEKSKKTLSFSKSAFENKDEKSRLLKFCIENPNSVEQILQSWLESLIVEPDSLTLEEEEANLNILKKTFDFCLGIICGAEDSEAYLKDLEAKGIIKSNVCGTIWKDGGWNFIL